jgi:hypothetical protein
MPSLEFDTQKTTPSAAYAHPASVLGEILQLSEEEGYSQARAKDVLSAL